MTPARDPKQGKRGKSLSFLVFSWNCWPKPRFSRSRHLPGHFYQARAHETYSRPISSQKFEIFYVFSPSIFNVFKNIRPTSVSEDPGPLQNERSQISDSVTPIESSPNPFPTHFVPKVCFCS